MVYCHIFLYLFNYPLGGDDGRTAEKIQNMRKTSVQMVRLNFYFKELTSRALMYSDIFKFYRN